MRKLFMSKATQFAAALAALPFLSLTVRAEDWPQWLGPKRDAVWSETGIIDTFPMGGPKVLWHAKVSGGYAGPAVANGKVYVMDYVTDGNNKGEIYERGAFKGVERVLCLSADKGEL